MTARLDRELAGNHFNSAEAGVIRRFPTFLALGRDGRVWVSSDHDVFGWVEEQDPAFVLAPGWEPSLCKSPEYRLNLARPPMLWRKKDRDRWKSDLTSLRERGHIIW